MLTLLVSALLVPCGPGLQPSFLAAVLAWGRAPVSITSVQWCDDAPGEDCSLMEQSNVWGWCEWDTGVITIDRGAPQSALQSLMSHEVGHCLGIHYHTPHGIMSLDWTPPVQALPNATDRELLP